MDEQKQQWEAPELVALSSVADSAAGPYYDPTFENASYSPSGVAT